MKAAVALLILSLVSASQAGYLGNGATYSVRMPYTNPAGVTYIEGPAPAGLAAGPIVQTAGVYSAVSPVAHLAPVAHQVAQVAAPLPLTYSAAHVKTASVGYAAVPTVQHVPAVQDVPYTRIEATPGFVQKELDVAKPAIATRKFEVRRPAIQKEFYDIEERVVVRPAGSAVVELDQPLSKTQKGQTIIQTPAVAAVAPVAHVARVAPVAAVTGVAAVSPVAYAGLAKTYSPFIYHSAHFTQPIVAGQFPQAFPTPLPAQVPVQPAQPAQPEVPQQQFEQPQQQPQQQFEQPQQQFEQPQQQFEQPQQQLDQQPQQQFEQPQQQLDQPQQDNSDDTVEVGNPEIAGRSAAPQPTLASAPSAAPQQPAPQDDTFRQIKTEEESIEARRQELATRMAQLEERRRQQEVDVADLIARQRNLNVAAAAAVNPASLRSSQNFGRPGQLTEARFLAPRPLAAQPQPQAESRSALPQEQRQPQPQPQAEARSIQPNVEIRSLGSPVDNLVPAPRTGNDVVPSVRNLSPEQDQENQQRLIDLLTARVQRAFLYLVQGGVAEVGNQARATAVTAAALDAGQVRARVLSATPAPPGAEPTNERVSTRRVVVSRPIQTVQEVDVVEPFTKIHRLSVQQPALFKTARVDVARVHTAVPVYGKALTPYTVYH